MDVDARLLRYFVVLSEELHFGRAAARLFVSQPALSQQLRRLEERLSLSLFTRTRRQVALTPAGAALLPRARAVLVEMDGFMDHARLLGTGRSGRITVGFIAQAANELTPLIVRDFMRRRPDVQIDMRQSNLDDTSAGLRAGAVDVAFVRLPIESDGLETLPLLTEPRVVVLAADHPLARRRSVSLADISDEPRVVTLASDPVFRAFALAGPAQEVAADQQIGAAVTSVDEFLEAVLAGRGTALAPESARRYYNRPGVAYVDVVDAAPSVVALAWRAGARHPPSVLAFIETCARIAADNA